MRGVDKPWCEGMEAAASSKKPYLRQSSFRVGTSRGSDCIQAAVNGHLKVWCPTFSWCVRTIGVKTSTTLHPAVCFELWLGPLPASIASWSMSWSSGVQGLVETGSFPRKTSTGLLLPHVQGAFSNVSGTFVKLEHHRVPGCTADLEVFPSCTIPVKDRKSIGHLFSGSAPACEAVQLQDLQGPALSKHMLFPQDPKP